MKPIARYALGLVMLVGLVLSLTFGTLWGSRDSETDRWATPQRPSELEEGSIEALFTALEWTQQGGRSSSCARLTIDETLRPHYAQCGQAGAVGALSPEEMRTYLIYLARYTPFDEVIRGDASIGANGLVFGLRFPGRGSRQPSSEDRAEIARWAAQLYDRLARERREGEIVASARTLLAQRLGISPDGITTYSVEAITWPSACLDIRVKGMDCAQVRTPGYRILLQVDDLVYEYRTDLYEKVYGLETAVRPRLPTPQATPLPTIATPTATPTTTAAPTATAVPTSTPIQITEWRGEYYANLDLSGEPVLVSNDSAVSFDWGHDAPAYGLPPDGFSVRWTRRLLFEEGWYDFQLRGDDGVRLRLDSHVVIERWEDGWSDDSVKLHLWAGYHDVVVEFYEHRGVASVDLHWEEFVAPASPTPTSEPTETLQCEAGDEAWTAVYWNEPEPEGEPILTRHESQLDLDWGRGSPDERVQRDHFSARFTREFVLPEGLYRLRVRANDRVRVYVDDQLVIDGWHDVSRKQLTERLRLSGPHTFRIDYAEITGRASLSFSVERESSE